MSIATQTPEIPHAAAAAGPGPAHGMDELDPRLPEALRELLARKRENPIGYHQLLESLEPPPDGQARYTRPEILMYTPIRAINIGYTIYVADTSRPDSLVYKESMETIGLLAAGIRDFPPNTPEAFYLTAFWNSAISFARGLDREKFKQKRAAAVARRRMNIGLRANVLTESVPGLIRGALNVITAGGLAASFYKLLYAVLPGFVTRAAEGEKAAPGGWSGAIFFGTAAALVTTVFQIRRISRFQKRLFDEYDRSRERARVRFSEGAFAQFTLSMVAANTAWTWLTGQPPPREQAFRLVLAEVMGVLEVFEERAKRGGGERRAPADAPRRDADVF